MSFINIKSEEKNLYKLLNHLRDEKLSVDACKDILSKTNAFQITKAMLGKINKLEIEEKREYKDVIISMFDRRLQRDEEKNVALDIAKECGFEDELNNIIKKTGGVGYQPKHGVNIYVIDSYGFFYGVDFSSYDGIYVEEWVDEIDFNFNDTLNGGIDLSNVKKVHMASCDLGGTILKFGDGAEVCLSKAKNLPENLDVSMCKSISLNGCDLEGISLIFREGANVYLRGVSNLPKTLDLSMCNEVDLDKSDFSSVECVIFKEGAHVFLREVSNLPKTLDLSMCNEVKLNQSDFSSVDCIIFKERACVDLRHATNLPKNLDVSMCGNINLIGCDLEGINLKFREGSLVDLSKAKNLPENLDVSMCEAVDFIGCNLSRCNLIFKKGAIINMNYAEALPQNLDFSMCDEVHLEEASLGNVKKIKFKNREQRDKSGIVISKDWKGKIVYEENGFDVAKTFVGRMFNR